MTLNVAYFSTQVMRHPSGRSYAPNASNICTIPATDAFSWQGGSGVPGGLPPATIFPGQLLRSTNQGQPQFLYFTGATTDRPVPNTPSTTQAFMWPDAAGFAAPYYDTTLSKFVFYVGPGFGSTNWTDQNGLFV